MSTGAQASGDARAAWSEPELLKVGDVAQMLAFGERTVMRMSDAGKMPPPFKIGGSVRWSRRALRTWIDDGCPAVRALPRPR
jgi:predicted DNA-binding transcriptional regulator AlpA